MTALMLMHLPMNHTLCLHFHVRRLPLSADIAYHYSPCNACVMVLLQPKEMIDSNSAIVMHGRAVCCAACDVCIAFTLTL